MKKKEYLAPEVTVYRLDAADNIFSSDPSSPFSEIEPEEETERDY